MDYQIVTDSSCDLPAQLLAQWQVGYVSLRYYAENAREKGKFYDQMRQGTVFKTAAANVDDFKNIFVPILEAGKDILYIGFSSGLSSTVNAGAMAAKELQEQYPQRKILTVDTLAASAGQGFLVQLAVQKQAQGVGLEENAQYITDSIRHMCHWFTVDDLVYLKRGGRVSPTTALVGNLIGIKPILHMDDEGHLIKVSTIRGRKASIHALADQYTQLSTGDAEGMYMISHGDCLEDAKQLEAILRERTEKDAALIVEVGPVIGSHSGPGTLALFFLGKHR